MIKIKIPNNNISERKYIIDILFNEFLGLEYSLEIGSIDYEIILSNQKNLTIKDTFFNKYPKYLEYLKLENIPKDIYELDIFALSFFMLTRWEEYVNKNRDSHNRFPAYESLAYKQGFLDRPIVNEELEKLKKQLLWFDSSLKFKKREFELILTHDVDDVKFWKSKKQLFRIVVGDILKRKDIKLAISRVKEYYLVSSGKIKDPFDTFDWLMDRSEELGLKSRFYFMSGGITKYDNRYDIREQKQLIDKMVKRGHIIGIHPSYNAYNSFEQLKKEKELLEDVIGNKIVEGREHYLRFEVPTTWQIWEDNGLEIDSTCGYTDKEGFRCGVCYEYSVFNILRRKKLNLKEKPLVVMEGSFLNYQTNIQPIEMEEKIFNLINEVKKYKGQFIFLWHNSSFNTAEWKKYTDIYSRIVGESL
jgi:hypothetical protein